MIGKYPAKLDEKGRLIVPSKLRGELGSKFFVTYGFNGDRKCLTAYKDCDWTVMEGNYNNLPLSKRSGHSERPSTGSSRRKSDACINRKACDVIFRLFFLRLFGF